ncbi:Uncharacterised protein [Bacteroides xylanisolvens]|nr:Uncharacterised protein [Bacteroides xylanisolvens]
MYFHQNHGFVSNWMHLQRINSLQPLEPQLKVSYLSMYLPQSYLLVFLESLKKNKT